MKASRERHQEIIDERTERLRVEYDELDRGEVVPIMWSRICSGCGKSFKRSEPTRRTFEEQTYGGTAARFPIWTVPKRKVKCPDCEGSKNTFKE